ncbi:MAG TPA: amino acid permease C-terminal domain-containing protein, partial [Gemmatimonadales bacterium]
LVSAGVIVLRTLEPDRVRPFRAPLVPLTPLISIVTCLYLMLQLPKLTWIRFGIWLVLGLLIYIFYGIRHSRLGRAAARGER